MAMTEEEVVAFFDTDEMEAEFLKFERVENNRSTRPDLHTFLLLDSLKPGSKKDMVCSADHDEIWLDFTLEDLAEIATPELLIELHRCGVRVDEDAERLCMFA